VTRALLVCPGRGSYAERALGSLPVGHPFVERADALRAGYGLPSLAELDRAARFDPKLHLRPANVSLLIWLVNLIDAEAAAAEHEITCVAGNSMGWYTALAVTGALSFEHGFRLVQDMALLQEEHQAEHGGGQMIQPWVDDDWRPDAARRAAIEDVLASSDGEALLSIDLGGYAVLAGSEAGLKHLARTLPKVALGQTTYPFRLMQHGAYHTDGPPTLLDQTDMLVYNAVATLLLKCIAGTATAQEVSDLAANWSVFQGACVRPLTLG
jgi:malonyl CoA-acyl carrier protein transacylase